MAPILLKTIFLLSSLVLSSPTQLAVSSSTSSKQWSLGGGFKLQQASDKLEVLQGASSIWSTVAGKPFISASAGNDSIIESSGAFYIKDVDIDTCEKQSIDQVKQVTWDGSVSGKAAQVTGHLRNCGDASTTYTLTFWVPSNLTDRVAWNLDISKSSKAKQPLKKLYFSYASNAEEGFYGLGAQASFGSLKGQNIPIFSREQGVGRGDAVITQYENQNDTFAGGNRFTTYTAIPSYVSTDGNVFYLSESSTAYARFDFTEPDAVTLRYDFLSAAGMFMRADNMFDAVEMLTAYTGRMPALPQWVDNGAVLGLEGGQAKVNHVVEKGLSDYDCPIAAVWLQDWCGIR